MLTTDQSHLRKYLATLGVAVVAGVITVSGLFLRLQDDLLVKESELSELTPSAEETIKLRQQYLETATAVLPWFVCIGGGTGVGLAAYGLVGWARRQEIADEREDIELRRLTAEERVAQLLYDAEAAVEDGASDTSEQPSAGLLKPIESPLLEGSGPVISESHRRTREIMAKAMETELQLAEKLHEAMGDDHVIEVGVAAKRGSVVHTYDIVARPPSGSDGSYVFEVKYTSNLDASRGLIRRALEQLAPVKALFGPDTIPVVFVVYESGATSHHSARAERVAREIQASLDTDARVLIMSASELSSLTPSDLVHRIESS